MTNIDLSKSVKATWQDEDVAARRSAKHHVRVRGHGEYRSVYRAFKDLGLPLKHHQAFRLELKRVGHVSFRHDGKSYLFYILH